MVKKFKAAYPNVTVDSAELSPVEGVYEIISGDRIAYYYPEKDILIAGNMIQKGTNLTRERIIARQTEKGKAIPIEKAIKIGSGKHQVIEFTDPDCPHCRSAFNYFNMRSDITKYVFLLPLASLHPQAEAKAKYVFNADDTVKAYKEVLSGGLDKIDLRQKKFSEKANARFSEQQKIAKEFGVNSTPIFWINGQYVQGADLRMFDRILGKNVDMKDP
ncbi:MAG: DsbC family protein [Deltaproteobacteria bacterium]|nr:DsbC family protein [Deltaproteobacteria bacterium]